MIEIHYGKMELKVPEEVDLKALAVFLNALRRHDLSVWLVANNNFEVYPPEFVF